MVTTQLQLSFIKYESRNGDRAYWLVHTQTGRRYQLLLVQSNGLFPIGHRYTKVQDRFQDITRSCLQSCLHDGGMIDYEIIFENDTKIVGQYGNTGLSDVFDVLDSKAATPFTKKEITFFKNVMLGVQTVTKKAAAKNVSQGRPYLGFALIFLGLAWCLLDYSLSTELPDLYVWLLYVPGLFLIVSGLYVLGTYRKRRKPLQK